MLDSHRVQVFFIDYGSFEVVNRKDTRDLTDNLASEVLDDIWGLPPLAFPCVLKSKFE